MNGQTERILVEDDVYVTEAGKVAKSVMIDILVDVYKDDYHQQMCDGTISDDENLSVANTSAVANAKEFRKLIAGTRKRPRDAHGDPVDYVTLDEMFIVYLKQKDHEAEDMQWTFERSIIPKDQYWVCRK